MDVFERRILLVLTMVVICNLQPFAQKSPRSRQEEESGDLNRQRSEWFYRQRAYPNGYVPAGAYQNAVRQYEGEVAAHVGDPDLPAVSWTSIGPQPINTPYTDPVVAGRVSALAIVPTNTNTIYLGGAQGGIWQTVNAGRSWKALTDAQPSLATGSIAIDPTNPLTIYVGTGEENFSGDSYYGAGVLKSTDGGTTWVQYCGPFCGPIGQDTFYGGGGRIGSLAIDPANPQLILAAVQLLFSDGIYRSADGGQTWAQVMAGNPGNAVIFDPTGATAYASLGNSFFGGTEGVYKSTDGGLTWTADNGTGSKVLPIANAARIALAMAPSAPATLYAGVADVNTGNLLGMYKTTDGGANWNRLNSTPDYCTPQCSYDNVIAVQPTNPAVVFAGGAFSTTLIRTTNGGTSWTILQSAQNFGFMHADVHAISFTPDGKKLYVGNDGGVYSTAQITAANPVFTALNNTVSVTQFYPGLSISPTNVAMAMGGSQDNGTLQYSGSLTWNDVVCGDGGYTAIDRLVPTTVYATCQNIDIEKSTSGGMAGSWTQSQSGIDTSDRVDFIPPLVMDPLQSNTLYFGTYRVYQTKNGAASWAAISPDLTQGNSFNGIITTLAVAPTDSNTVYAGTGDSNVQVTRNAGSGAAATWTNITTTQFPPRFVTMVAVDPTTPTKAYVTYSGFTGFGDTLGHVFRTVNGGTSWTDISGNLPNTPVNAIVVNPNNAAEVFVGTDVGVFLTRNGGASWTPLASGLPRVAVFGLAYHGASQTLRAATHGRGMWDLHIQ